MIDLWTRTSAVSSRTAVSMRLSQARKPAFGSMIYFAGQHSLPATDSFVRTQPLPAPTVQLVRFGKDKDFVEANIPVIDLRDFMSSNPARQARFVKTLGDGLRDVGFVALKGHGIPKRKFDQHYRAMAHLFTQIPKDELANFAFVRTHGIERGYQPPGELKPHRLGDGTVVMKPDLKENWSTGTNFNVFPRKAPRMAKTNIEIFNRMQEIGLKLVDALAVYLEDKDGVLRSMVRDAEGKPTAPHLMRSIHYPKVEAQKLDALKPGDSDIRAGEHQDLSFFTMLPQATETGLQLKQKDGSWLNVHAQQGMIIVNAGDLLKFLTQDLTSSSGESRAIKSTPHRVVGDQESGKRDRYSNPFFFHLNFRGPVLDLRTKQPIRIVMPEKNIDVTLDEGLRFLHARLIRSNTLPPDMTYEKYRDRYFSVGSSLEKAINENQADAIVVK